MIRLSIAALLAVTSLLLGPDAPAAARPKAKPVDTVCGNTIAECQDAIIKAMTEANDFNLVVAGAIPPKVAEAFVRGVAKSYTSSSCLDRAARDSLTPEQIAAVSRVPSVELYDPATTQVELMVLSRTTLIARKSFIETGGDFKKLPFPGNPIVVRLNPMTSEDESPVADACGHTLGRLK